MVYRVIFTPQADSQLDRIEDYIAAAASPATAEAFIDAIIAACQSLSTFPNRGTRRDDIRPGLRSMGFRKRVTIVFEVEDDRVNIIGIFYAGQSLESTFQPDED